MTTKNPDDLAMKSQHFSHGYEVITQLSAEHVFGTTFVVASQVTKGPPYDKDAKIVRNANALRVSRVAGTNKVEVAQYGTRKLSQRGTRNTFDKMVATTNVAQKAWQLRNWWYTL